MTDIEKIKAGIFEMLQRNTWKDIDNERHRFQPVLNDALKLLKEQEAMNVDSFVQWCVDNHIVGDATISGIKYWVGKFKEGR